MSRRARDAALLDALEALPHAPLETTAWRITREGRDPLACFNAGGRWDDGSFDVLYTSLHPDGARAELHFHLSAGQPVVPSKPAYRLHELRIRLAACLTLPSLEALAALGVQTARYGQLSHAEREREYPRTQDIAEAAQFLGRDGLVVPSARSVHPNLVVFCATAGEAARTHLADHGPVRWR